MRFELNNPVPKGALDYIAGVYDGRIRLENNREYMIWSAVWKVLFNLCKVNNAKLLLPPGEQKCKDLILAL